MGGAPAEGVSSRETSASRFLRTGVLDLEEEEVIVSKEHEVVFNES
jgi:hypothetical protein